MGNVGTAKLCSLAGVVGLTGLVGLATGMRTQAARRRSNDRAFRSGKKRTEGARARDTEEPLGVAARREVGRFGLAVRREVMA